MKDQIIIKLEKYDQQLENIAKTVTDNQEKLENHDKRFDSMDNRLDTVAIKVVDIQEQVNDIKKTMATKQDISNISNTLDVIVGLVKKTDEEQIFMGVRVKRIEGETEKNTKDIQKIKPLVGLKV